MGVRVHLGKLDAFGIIGYGLLVKTGILGTGTNTTIDDNGLAVSLSGIERVRVGALGGGDYGLKVVNAGSTVIIDGTSNMFKIAASGTLSLTGCDGTSSQCSTTTNVTLSTGFDYRPAFLTFVDHAAATKTRPMNWYTFHPSNHGVTRQIQSDVQVTGGTSTLLTLEWFTQNGLNTSSETRNFRYYVLEEAGI